NRLLLGVAPPRSGKSHRHAQPGLEPYEMLFEQVDVRRHDAVLQRPNRANDAGLVVRLPITKVCHEAHIHDGPPSVNQLRRPDSNRRRTAYETELDPGSSPLRSFLPLAA